MNITDQSLTQLETSIRQTPLAERLESAQRMISRMCSSGEPPRMSIPAQASDEDMYIITTLQDAAAELNAQKLEISNLEIHVRDLQGKLVAALERTGWQPLESTVIDYLPPGQTAYRRIVIENNPRYITFVGDGSFFDLGDLRICK